MAFSEPLGFPIWLKASNNSDNKSVVDDKNVTLAYMPFHVDENDISLIGKKAFSSY